MDIEEIRSKMLNTDFEKKINEILTNFVIEFIKDDNEERIDALHNETIYNITELVTETYTKLDTSYLNMEVK